MKKTITLALLLTVGALAQQPNPAPLIPVAKPTPEVKTSAPESITPDEDARLFAIDLAITQMQLGRSQYVEMLKDKHHANDYDIQQITTFQHAFVAKAPAPAPVAPPPPTPKK